MSESVAAIKSGGSGLVGRMQGYMTPKLIMIVAAVLAIIGFGVYYYYAYISPKLSPSFGDDSAESDDGSDTEGDVELILFYVDWCPHCKTAKPEWDSVRNEYENKNVNGYNLQFTEINCTEESPEVQEVVEQYGIEGYPTIKLLKGDQVIDFEAKPTKDTLTQFINTVVR